MALVYQSICYEADTLFLKLTKLTQKEIRYKVEIEKLMNNGFVGIAKARYIMGSTCVTKLQLPTENSTPIQPLVTVSRAQLNNRWLFHIHRKKMSSNRDENSREGGLENGEVKSENSIKITYDKFDNKSATTFMTLLQNDPKNLKKSKNAFCVDDDLYNYYHEEYLDEMSTMSNDSLQSVANPIRLFGILVPNALKEAQEDFTKVVNLLGKCASLQSELTQVLQRYNHLITVKELVEAAALDIKMNISGPKVYWTPESSMTSEISIESVPEKGEEEEEEEEEDGDKIKEGRKYTPSRGSVKKSIVSVFYDLDKVEEEESEMSIWGSQKTIESDEIDEND